MVGIDWGLAVLIVYPLAQVPLVLYLARRFELDGEVPAATPGRTFWTERSAEEVSGEAATAPPGRCHRCGANNDPAFSYCRVCVRPL